MHNKKKKEKKKKQIFQYTLAVLSNVYWSTVDTFRLLSMDRFRW